MKHKRNIFTWHIHGSYLYYLTQCKNCEFYLPVNKERSHGYGGKSSSFAWGDNVHEVPIEEVKNLNLDVILFQSNYGGRNAYLEDRYEILSEQQRTLPKIYVEHDPPREHPTDTKHIVDDPETLLVHVTHFNDLMWDNGKTPTTVIEHGITLSPNASYTGKKEKGIVVINGLSKRGRRLGLDIFEKVRKEIPLDLIGMEAEELGGIGEIPYTQLHSFIADYRFFFSPIRYTSLGLSICEAMMMGMPVVGLATTELPTVIENNLSGYIHTDVDWLIEKMQYLLDNPIAAHRIGQGAQAVAQKRFSIERFIQDWQVVFNMVGIIKTTNQATHIDTYYEAGGVL